MSGIYTALSGAVAMDHNLDVLSNNLANVSTPGYKSVKPSFEAVMAKAQGAQGAQAGGDPRRDVNLATMGTDLSQGALVETGNDLDVALQGDGFMVAEVGGGARYTRRGTLSLDNQGRLSVGGAPLRAVGGGHINVPEQAYVSIESDGAVFADDVLVGQIELVRFNDPGAVRPAGGGFYEGNGAVPDNDTEVAQGFVEQSNVDAVWGMTELIRTTRIFEASQKAIKVYKDIDNRLATDVARI